MKREGPTAGYSSRRRWITFSSGVAQARADRSAVLAPGPDIIGHGLDARLDFHWLGQIALEGGLGAGGFARTPVHGCGGAAFAVLRPMRAFRPNSVATRPRAERGGVSTVHIPEGRPVRKRGRWLSCKGGSSRQGASVAESGHRDAAWYGKLGARCNFDPGDNRGFLTR